MIDKDINSTRQKRKSSEARSSLMVFPNDTNDFGTMYGGRLIELMDMVGGICARRYTGTKAVTATGTASVAHQIPISKNRAAVL